LRLGLPNDQKPKRNNEEDEPLTHPVYLRHLSPTPSGRLILTDGKRLFCRLLSHKLKEFLFEMVWLTANAR
jgi:hypothetical protein